MDRELISLNKIKLFLNCSVDRQFRIKLTSGILECPASGLGTDQLKSLIYIRFT